MKKRATKKTSNIVRLNFGLKSTKLKEAKEKPEKSKTVPIPDEIA